MASSAETNTVESKTAADYLDPTREPEPSAETGPGTHFSNTFDAELKSKAPNQPQSETKLKDTDSTMTTAQLQQAAADAQQADPNILKKLKK